MINSVDATLKHRPEALNRICVGITDNPYLIVMMNLDMLKTQSINLGIGLKFIGIDYALLFMLVFRADTPSPLSQSPRALWATKG